MTQRPGVPFAGRLALARQLVATGARPAPVHLADQYGAAGEEARGLHDRIGALLPRLQPDPEWSYRSNADAPDEVRAYLLAALLGCMQNACCHLRRGGPQPASMLLPLRRIACARCAGIIRRPPADEADRCDVCGAHGVEIFHPFTVQLGAVLVAGDVCRACAAIVDVVEAAS